MFSSGEIYDKNLYAFLNTFMPPECPAYLILLDLSTLITFGKQYNLRSCSLRNFLQACVTSSLMTNYSSQHPVLRPCHYIICSSLRVYVCLTALRKKNGDSQLWTPAIFMRSTKVWSNHMKFRYNFMNFLPTLRINSELSNISASNVWRHALYFGTSASNIYVMYTSDFLPWLIVRLCRLIYGKNHVIFFHKYCHATFFYEFCDDKFLHSTCHFAKTNFITPSTFYPMGTVVLPREKANGAWNWPFPSI